MSTLREVVIEAASDAFLFKNTDASWAGVFIASLRRSGYWIAPVAPTADMFAKAFKDCGGIGGGSCGEHVGVDGEDLASVFDAMRDAYIKESGQ